MIFRAGIVVIMAGSGVAIVVGLVSLIRELLRDE